MIVMYCKTLTAYIVALYEERLMILQFFYPFIMKYGLFFDMINQ